ncbi:LytR/AlgR family response regulator transcription factor [Moheibacter sediminis]|uniref:Two component transcriptional regulator, LytTR family n=1 Tax=Moheibacter sediminis TaxID=1434700 RepID=A0A1W2CUG3_9FLAO|nr:response regulator transcription factor [Moheibacter sediminis]SMC88853.1 two component transcriptional regulator, LytTR family [Moheibacter sediminis]
MNIKCMIVEDEPLAVEVIQDYISQIPFLQLQAVCNDAICAMQTLKEKQIDLMFLDIHLPKLKGLDLLATLKNPPKVIITTAYHEFAVKSYEFSVLDYLMKPIEFSRFMAAVQKALPVTSNSETVKHPEEKDLFFSVNKKKARVPVKSILYIESQRENIRIVMEDREIITRYSITDLENELPDDFVRIHRSFIVSKSKIDFFDMQDVEIKGKLIPIGRNYKDFVKNILGN